MIIKLNLRLNITTGGGPRLNVFLKSPDNTFNYQILGSNVIRILIIF